MKSILTLLACTFSFAVLPSNFLCAASDHRMDGEIQFNSDIQFRGCGCQGGGKKTPSRPLPVATDN